MASRILHYAVALEVAKLTKITDIKRFVIGNLLPDASSHSDGSYSEAHFSYAGDGDERRGINWAEYAARYEERIWGDELYLGYLCHLIADAVWLNRIADPYVRIYTGEERVRCRLRGYRDFQKLNGIMIQEYGLTYPELDESGTGYEELPVDGKMIGQLFQAFETDFHVERQYDAGDLEIYPYEAVKAFIDESTQVCVQEINAMKTGGERMSPVVYYVNG